MSDDKLKKLTAFEELCADKKYPNDKDYSNSVAKRICAFYDVQIHELSEKDTIELDKQSRDFTKKVRSMLNKKSVSGHHDRLLEKHKGFFKGSFNLPFGRRNPSPVPDDIVLNEHNYFLFNENDEEIQDQNPVPVNPVNEDALPENPGNQDLIPENPVNQDPNPVNTANEQYENLRLGLKPLTKKKKAKKLKPPKKQKEFENYSRGHQSKLVKDHRSVTDDKLIMSSAAQIMKETRGPEARFIIRKMVKEKTFAKKLKSKFYAKVPKKLSPTEALAYICRQNLSRRKYTNNFQLFRQQNAPVLPSWEKTKVSEVHW